MSFPRFDLDFIEVKMSSHQTSAKPRSSKCRHFCFLFDTHNFFPTCRVSGKGDDPCVTNQSPCNICTNFSEEQQIKIKHRRRYVRKQKASDPCNTSKDDNLDLLRTTWRHFLALKQTLRVLLIMKRPARDAFLCIGENQAPPAPRFIFLITL